MIHAEREGLYPCNVLFAIAYVSHSSTKLEVESFSEISNEINESLKSTSPEEAWWLAWSHNMITEVEQNPEI